MNILLHIKNLRIGGAQRHLVLLANGFAELGNNVTIVVLNDYPKPEFNINERIRIIYLKKMIEDKNVYFPRIRFFSFIYKYIYFFLLKCISICFKGDKKRKYKQNLKQEFNLYRFFRYIIKKEKIDISISFMNDSTIILNKSVKGTKSKFCIAQMSYPTKELVKKLELKKIYKEADLCVFQTKEQMDFFNNDNSVVIFNPLTKKYPEFTNSNNKTVVNFCRFCREKNLPLLFEAFGKFLIIHPDYSLVLYGDDDENISEGLLEYARKNHFEQNVSIYPATNNIHDIIIDCSMFVTSSEWEGISNSLIEAMACGLPTIATDCIGGGARAMIEDHVNGLLVPRGDSDALCKAMCEIAESKGLVRLLSENALMVNETLKQEKIIQKWVDEFEKILHIR